MMLAAAQQLSTIAIALFVIVYVPLQYRCMRREPAKQIRLHKVDLYSAPPPLATSKPAYFVICAVVKDENKNLREWIHYHHWLGAGTIYLYDHNSSLPLLDDISDWVDAGAVNYERFAGFPSHNSSSRPQYLKTGQGHGFNSCLAKAKANGNQWAAFIDPDEFLVLYKDSHRDMPRFLKRYEKHAALVVNWRVFGSSGHRHRPQEPALLAYTKCHLADTYNKQYKSVVHLPDVVGVHNNPHMFRYAPGKYAVDEEFQNVTEFFHPAPKFSSIGLHHYVLRSADEFAAKMARGGGSGKRRTKQYWHDINLLARGHCRQGAEIGKQWLNITVQAATV